MKIRSGFVSNSSSSSFIITGKDNISKAIDLINNCKEGYFDYYLINSKLYTSPISDCYVFWDTIKDLSTEDLEHHGGPYDGEKVVEGDRGVTSVYVPKYEFSKKDEDKRRVKDELYSLCKKWVYDNDYHNFDEIEHDIYQNCDYAAELLQQIYNIIGYYPEETNDED